MAEKLTPDEIQTRLADLDGWLVGDGGESISKEYKFKDFKEAFCFMAASAVQAEKLGHHPDWSNVYNSVKVTLSTHDAGGLTALDFELAEAMDLAAE